MEEKTTKSKRSSGGLLPKMEFLIIVVFFLSFIIWAVSKCDSKQQEYQDESTATATVTTDPDLSTEPPAPDTATMPAATTTTPARPEKVTTLYVVLDGLKLRSGPHLDSTVVRTLKEGSEVFFMNETTKFKQAINLGARMAYEPWIRVRVYTGHEGWVYGAGVHYFKGEAQLDTLPQ